MSKSTGLTLLDIGPLTELVPVSDSQSLTVTGISAEGCLNLFARFPALQKYLVGGGISINDMLASAPELLAAIIAAGTGTPGDTEAERVALGLPIEIQMDILEAIGRLTFRSGFGPFVQRLIALTGVIVVAKSDNSGKANSTTSPPVSKPLSPPDTTPDTSGSTPPAE